MSKPFDLGDAPVTDAARDARGQSPSGKRATKQQRAPADEPANVGVRGRRTGLTVKTNVAKDADQLDNIEDFFASPKRKSMAGPATVTAVSSARRSSSKVASTTPAAQKPAVAPALSSSASRRKSAGGAPPPPVAAAKKTPVWAKRKNTAAVPVPAARSQPEPDTESDIDLELEPMSDSESEPEPEPLPEPLPVTAASSWNHSDADVSILDIDEGLRPAPIKQPSPSRKPKSADITTIVQRLSFDDEEKHTKKRASAAAPKTTTKSAATAATKTKAKTTGTAATAAAKTKPKSVPKVTAATKGKRKNTATDDEDQENTETQPLPKRSKVDEDSENDGTRKSSRHRIAPIAFWKNEKVVYKEMALGDPMIDENAFVPTVAAVIRSKSPDIIAPKRSRRPGKPAASSAAVPSSSASSAKETFVVKGFNKLGVGKDKVAVFDPVAKADVPQAIIRMAADASFTDASFGKLAKSFDTPAFQSGHFVIPKGGVKKSSNSKANYVVFVVQHGAVGVIVHKTRFALTVGDSCYVPPHNLYQLENIGNGDAALHYVYVPHELSSSA